MTTITTIVGMVMVDEGFIATRADLQLTEALCSNFVECFIIVLERFGAIGSEFRNLRPSVEGVHVEKKIGCRVSRLSIAPLA